MIKRNSLEERVYKVISQHEEGTYAKNISWITGIKLNTVKGILAKLRKENRIQLKEGIRGLYIITEKDPHGSIFNYTFHNLVLTCPIPSYEGELQPIVNNTNEMIKTRLVLGRTTKLATLHLSSDYPINISSLLIVAQNFILQIKTATGIDVKREEITVSSIEFNKDYTNLRLDGVNCVTLDSMLAQYKLYQKESCVREEFKMKVPIDMLVIAELLKKGQFQAENRSEIGQLREEIKIVRKQQADMQRLMSRMVNNRFTPHGKQT